MAFFVRDALRHASLLLACLGLVMVLGSRARAESEDDERARAHFVAAEAYYQDGRFSEAAREFEEAYQLSGRPEMLINLARAQERANDPSGAITTLELLLGRYPQTSYKLEAETQLAKLRELRPASAETAPVEVAPVAEPVTSAEPEKRKVWPPRWPTLAVGGAAVASVLVAVGTGWAAHAKYGDLDDRCPGGACDEAYEHDRDRGQRLSRTSTGFTFVAVALGGVTAALWILDLKSERAHAQLGVRSSLTSYEANLRLSF